MQWHGKWPSVRAWGDFVAILNSRGGNILVLVLAAVYFFRYSMILFWELLRMVSNKTVTPDNAFAMMAIQFVTTGAFGGAMGALLKTMTGESSKARSSDSLDAPPNGTSTTHSTTSTEKTTTVASPPLQEIIENGNITTDAQDDVQPPQAL